MSQYVGVPTNQTFSDLVRGFVFGKDIVYNFSTTSSFSRTLNTSAGEKFQFSELDPTVNATILSGSQTDLVADSLRYAIKMITSFVDVKATETSDFNSANLFLFAANIPPRPAPGGTLQTNGFASPIGKYLADGSPEETEDAYVVMHSSPAYRSTTDNVDSGNHLTNIAIHEILHIFGLKDFSPSDTTPLNNQFYSIMSYNTRTGSSGVAQGKDKAWSLTPTAVDIAALHSIYTAKDKALGNTEYVFSTTMQNDIDAGSTITLSNGYYAIWDTGGFDFINFNGINERALINLNAATVDGVSAGILAGEVTMLLSNMGLNSSLLPQHLIDTITSAETYEYGALSTIFDNVGFESSAFQIANGVAIEGAHGGSKDDILIGNEHNNRLAGGAGNDIILGLAGDDVIDGGDGDDIINGGDGANIVHGGKGDDKIWFNLEGDFVKGGDGNDHFYLDASTSISLGATIHGGADFDRITVDESFILANPDWAITLATTGKIGGLEIVGVEEMIVVNSTNMQLRTFNLQTFAEDFFANRISGLTSPNTVGSVSTAFISDVISQNATVYAAQFDFSSNLTITGYSATFDYFGTHDLIMNLSHWADKIDVTLSLPSGFEYNFDANQIAGWLQQNTIQIDYEYTEAVITDDGVIEYIIPATKYYTSFTGVQNSYDNGLTQIIGPDVVYADRWLYDQSTGSTEVAYSHDSIEPGKPVRYWLSNDSSGLLQIDSETGIVTTRSNLFRDGQTVLATIVASDGISEVTKDIEVRLDTTLETAPVFLATNELPEVLPVIGSGAGTFDWADDNYGEKWRFAVEVVGATASNPLFKISPDGMPGFVIARAPTAAEIGVTHQVKITITDDTGQSDTAFMNVHFDPLEGVMEGTSGDDYLTPPAWSERIWTINGGEGNDDLDTGYLNNRIGKTALNGGDGDDMLSLNADYTVGNGDAGDDNIFVYADNTTANGGSGNDTINSWGYDTLINGDDGDDIISAYYDRATINGGAGNDTITFYGADAIVDGGSGDDIIHSFGQGTIRGGAGADTIYTLNDTIVFKDLSDSYLDNVSLTGNSGPSGLWDTIFGVNDDTIIDLSAFGEIEWAGSSTSSTSMLATMIQGDNPGDAFFAIDANRDGGFDFGIQLHNIQAANAIHFNGLSDWNIL